MVYIFLLITTTQLFCAAAHNECISLKMIFIPPAERSREHKLSGYAQTSWQASSIPGLDADGAAVMISRSTSAPDKPHRDALESTIVNLIPITLAQHPSIHIEEAVKIVIARVNEKLLTRFLATDKILYNYVIAVQHGDMKVFFKVPIDSTTSMPVPLPADRYIQEWKPGVYPVDRVEDVALEIHQ